MAVIDKHYGHLLATSPRQSNAAGLPLHDEPPGSVLLPKWAEREFGDESAEEAACRQPLRR